MSTKLKIQKAWQKEGIKWYNLASQGKDSFEDHIKLMNNSIIQTKNAWENVIKSTKDIIASKNKEISDAKDLWKIEGKTMDGNINDFLKAHNSIKTSTQNIETNSLDISKAIDEISKNLNENVDYSIDYKTKLLDPINVIWNKISKQGVPKNDQKKSDKIIENSKIEIGKNNEKQKEIREGLVLIERNQQIIKAIEEKKNQYVSIIFNDDYYLEFNWKH